MVDRRFGTHRLFGAGSSKVGSSIESRVRGIPMRQGLMNWSKKLRFMVRFMVWY